MRTANGRRFTSRAASLLSASVVLCVLLSGAAAWADGKGRSGDGPAEYTGPKKRIAVMNMEAEQSQPGSGAAAEWAAIFKRYSNIHTQSEVGLRLTEMLTTALQNTNRFVLLERKNISDVRDEIRVGEELGNAKTSVKKGGVLGAQMLVRCTVTEFSDSHSHQGGGLRIPGIGDITGSRKRATVTVDLRFVDPVTSRGIASEKATGTAGSSGGLFSGVLAGIPVVFGTSRSDPIESATRDAIVKAVEIVVRRMEPLPWEGRVAAAQRGDNGTWTIYINRGEEDGLHEGDVLTLYKPGDEVIDPEDGQSLGRGKDKRVGLCRVEGLSKRLSGVVLAEGTDVQVGYVVKLAAK